VLVSKSRLGGGKKKLVYPPGRVVGGGIKKSWVKRIYPNRKGSLRREIQKSYTVRLGGLEKTATFLLMVDSGVEGKGEIIEERLGGRWMTSRMTYALGGRLNPKKKTQTPDKHQKKRTNTPPKNSIQNHHNKNM